MSVLAKETASTHDYARALARRLEAIGIDAFSSQRERYLVLLQGSPGEIIDLGKPLRGSRIFGNQAARKNIPIVSDFTAFAQEDGLRDCMFWGVGITGAKAAPDNVVEALKDFNRKINLVFSDLRKQHAFEMLLLAIHPRFDPDSGLFDLHAHFVCRVPRHEHENVSRKLMVKFSKVDLPTRPIRNAGAVSTYMLWGIWRNKHMIAWPDHALAAAWSLTQHRFRFFRAGGSFAKWRTSKAPTSQSAARPVEKADKLRNRSETADPRQLVVTGDRLLSKVKVRYGDSKVAALLFETSVNDALESRHENTEPSVEYSSATIAATQESMGDDPHVCETKAVGKPNFSHGLKSRIIALFQKMKKLISAAANTLYWGWKNMVHPPERDGLP
ncbi:hypothetical protein [Mycoplana dimorpha]|uniref:Uncharacterized protein n=1 Tax=Mycoplana dimorpha TaxID=28320 RepID=A0A2T5B1J7_MYCDI|nr:hypothetical protein [Mycoplana dimorpha]PTM92867.1 hypothetical protein C7449_107281 [Mycoplana dimorpha]